MQKKANNNTKENEQALQASKERDTGSNHAVDILSKDQKANETIKKWGKYLNENDSLRYYFTGKYVTDDRICKNGNCRDEFVLPDSRFDVPEELDKLIINEGMHNDQRIFNTDVTEGHGGIEPSVFDISLTEDGKKLLREYKSHEASENMLR